MNDPLELLSLLILGFSIINAYFKRDQAAEIKYTDADISNWYDENEFYVMPINQLENSAHTIQGLKSQGLYASRNKLKADSRIEVINDDTHKLSRPLLI